jgi:hypothetical protein
MSAYSPTLPRTAELRGTDRLLVLVGSMLTDLGRRRAVARTHAAGSRRRVATATDHGSAVVLGAASDRVRDRAAVSRVSLLP